MAIRFSTMALLIATGFAAISFAFCRIIWLGRETVVDVPMVFFASAACGISFGGIIGNCIASGNRNATSKGVWMGLAVGTILAIIYALFFRAVP